MNNVARREAGGGPGGRNRPPGAQRPAFHVVAPLEIMPFCDSWTNVHHRFLLHRGCRVTLDCWPLSLTASPQASVLGELPVPVDPTASTCADRSGGDKHTDDHERSWSPEQLQTLWDGDCHTGRQFLVRAVSE